MVWDILIISLFFEKMRGKKGGSRREGEGGWVQVLSTSVSNDSTKFFFRLSGVNCIYSSTASNLFLFLGKEL